MSFSFQDEITALIRRALATELGEKIQEHNTLEEQLLEAKDSDSMSADDLA